MSGVVAESTWPVKRMRFLVRRDVSEERRRVLDGVTRATFLPMEAVGDRGDLDLSATRYVDEVRNGYTQFVDGDVLVAKITPCFENGKGALVKATLNGIGFGTTELHVLTPTSEIDGRYLYYTTVSDRFRKLGEAAMFGAAGQKRVPEEFVANYRVPVPPIGQQRAIADYLDRETARLDALVAAKERLLKLLAEKRRAIVTRAVTRGLPPEAARAADLDPHPKIKSSGLDWIGDVPDHWAVVPLVRITETIQTGPFGSQLHAADYVEGGVPLVNPAHMVAGRLVPDENSTVDEVTAERLKRHELRVGDIVMARRGEIGRCGAVGPDEAGWLCGTGSLLIRLRECDASYFSMLFACAGFSQLLALHAVGTTMANLNPMIVGRMLVPVPPFTEQRAVAAYLNRTTERLDALMDRVRKAMRLAKERRAALVAAAVTGSLDVGRMPCG